MRDRTADQAANRQDHSTGLETDPTFDQVLATYRATFFKIAATFEADSGLREDLLQEILLSVWQALPRFKGASSLQTYVYRVAYNRALNHVTKQSRLPKHEELDDAEIQARQASEPDPDSNQRIERLMAAIRELPLIQRQLVTLTLDGLSYAEISEVTGLNSSNVGVKLHRAKTALRKLMEKTNV